MVAPIPRGVHGPWLTNYCIAALVGIKFGGFGQNIVFINLATFKIGNSFPQPKNDVTTTM